jgi:hypothetical protein
MVISFPATSPAMDDASSPTWQFEMHYTSAAFYEIQNQQFSFLLRLKAK